MTLRSHSANATATARPRSRFPRLSSLLLLLLSLPPTASQAATPTFETDIEFTASGDFNGDSYSDFIIVDKALGLYRIGYGSAAGTYSQAAALPTGLETIDALAVGRISDSAATPTADRFAVGSILANRVQLFPGSSPSYNASTALHLLGSGPDSIAIVNIPGAGDTAHEDIFGTCRYETTGLPVKLRQLRHSGTATTSLTSVDLASAHRSANPVELTSTSGFTHVALIGGAGGATETLRLYRPDAAGAVFLHTTNLTGTGNRYVHARFGSEATATFIAYRPGSADVQAFVISDLGSGSYQFGSAVSTTLAKTIKALYTIKESSGAARLLALHTDGSAAIYSCSAGVVALLSTIDLSSETGTPSGIVPLGNGAYQMLFSADGSGRSSRFISMTHNGSAWSKANGGNLATAAAYAAFANVLFMSQRPFLDDEPKVLASLRAGDWTTSTSLTSTASATAETFGGSTTGLANPGSVSLGSFPGATAGTMTNQVAPNLAVTSLSPVQGETVDTVTIDPPAGSYAGSVRFTLASSGGHTIHYRTGTSGSFSPYVLPQRLYLDTTVQYYSVTSTGERSAIKSAAYDFTQEADDQDSDSDGVPDFVEADYGLDPTAGQDSDNDGISDLSEILEGKDPNDSGDKPNHADLNGTNAQLHLSVTPAPYNGATATSTTADIDTQVQAHTLGGSLLGSGLTAPTTATVKASPIDATQRLITISTPAHYALVDGTSRPATAVESVGLVPLPAATGPSITFSFNPSASAASQVGTWLTAAQAAYATPAATAVTLDHFDTLALVLLERRLTTLLRNRGTLTTSQYANLTPFRTESDDSHRFINDADIANIEYHTGESLLLQNTLSSIETAIANASSDANITALRALVVDIHRIASALNDGSTNVGLPLDVLRYFINGNVHILPSTGINSGFNTHKSVSAAQVTAAGVAVDSILASLAARSSTTLAVTIDLTLDDASPDTLVRDQANSSTLYRLLNENGDAYDLPDTFDLTTGAVLSITGFNDLGSSGGATSIEVVSVSLTSIPAVSLADTDGDLLPDDWERLFFGGMAATAKTAGDTSGYSALQEYFAGTDPRDSTSTPGAAPADFSMKAVRINLIGSTQVEIRWPWPTAYLSPVDFTIYESSDLIHWTPTAHAHTTIAANTQRSLFNQSVSGRKFYFVSASLK